MKKENQTDKNVEKIIPLGLKNFENIADCKYAQWEITPKLQAVYGSNHWYAVKAISGGIGWLEAYYTETLCTQKICNMSSLNFK